MIALAAAWGINAFIGFLTGERPGGMLSDWWDIFSKAGRSPSVCTEPVPEILTAPRFAVGERVRVRLLPIELERFMSPERRELFQRCAGQILRVEAIDSYGSLELHVLDDGSQSPDRHHHILFIEPQHVERVG